MEIFYPKMINLEIDQSHLKSYKSFLHETVQEVSSIYQSLNSIKHQLDSCLNHLAKPAIIMQTSSESSGQPTKVAK